MSFVQQDFDSLQALEPGLYEDCTFSNCLLGNANFEHLEFDDCTFVDCDLTSTIWAKCALRTVHFRGCKLLGARFDNCLPFLLSWHFEHCILNYASLFRVKAPSSAFVNCEMIETDFTQADLSHSSFTGCRLAGSIFDDSVLIEVDFSSATGLQIDPDKNRITGALFSIENALGLLDKYEITIV